MRKSVNNLFVIFLIKFVMLLDKLTKFHVLLKKEKNEKKSNLIKTKLIKISILIKVLLGNSTWIGTKRMNDINFFFVKLIFF